MIDRNRLIDVFSKFGVTLNEIQAERFDKYAQLLVEWNEKINLTAITEAEEIIVKHFADSVMPFSMLDLPDNCSVIDVGTGAGFPSCPLKICRDDIKITLLDSLNKRIHFLEEVSNILELNAACIHGRAEECGQKPSMREKFDIATARAVAGLPELCEYCLPFVKKGGMFVALKGSSGREELSKADNAIKLLGGEIKNCKEYSLDNGDTRTLIVIKKISQTPTKYPRNHGAMTKKPL